MIKAVLFDLDDTLISELDYVKSGYKAIAVYLEPIVHLSVDIIFTSLWELFQVDSKMVFNRFFDSLNIKYKKEQILELISIYRNHEPNIQFYDDVLPFLNYLKESNIKTGIISDGFLETQKAKLEAIEANKYFDKIILTEELGREYWKPHPKAFEMMKEAFACEWEEMIFIGDNPEKDFYIKQIFPIKTIRIDREKQVYRLAVYLKDIKEDVEIYDLNELRTCLSS